ncbi:uncharacterized protein N7496_012822 [Penicillium cataractarum]|uniref:Zn(2)-C6 fungal-type domain-containing protein n=1 Tax=Penicillium cataractarum TaxID=2100454 RepID=A0A9W9R832_9EURO|nr:uncharacterized protein N7496_012822 [Penicillium cataractarum]KAJ5354389.1 hypothetical protein N7496_012822 [Penicillium cataractarum]
MGQLPKSVKVRSTCNACQQAKIRCGHEKPSCRRCQKHKIECIYSVSRRLGRPAKKKDQKVGSETQSQSPVLEIITDPSECEKKPRKPSKKKGHLGSNPNSTLRARSGRNTEKGVDEDRLKEAVESTENQSELISNRISGTLDNAASEYLCADIDIEDSFDPIPDFLTYCAGPVTYQQSSACLSSQPAGSVFSSAYTSLEKDFNAFRHNSTSGEFAETPAFKDTGPLSWVYETGTRLDFQCFQDPWAFDRIPSTDLLAEQQDHCFSFQSPGGSHDSEAYSPDNPDLFTGSEGSSTFGCSCYKHVMGQLVKSGVKSGASGCSNIDGLLACQKDLVLQTEAILQCKMCSQSENQAIMLIIIIVAIDSLLTVLDAAVTPSRAGCYDQTTETGETTAGRKKDFGGGFMSNIHACPLLVGGFPVPAEEKACFIRQVLQARLSMLLLAVRRIRVCMQQHLTAALSRGRLLMIMETDRRLQLVMMKIKMAVN